MTTIGEAMEGLSFGEQALHALPPDLRGVYRHFAGWWTGTHCGTECRTILDLAAPLLEVADPAAHLDLWRGIVAEKTVICVG